MIFVPAYHRSPGGNLPPFRQVIHATCPPQPANAAWSWSSQAGMAVSTAHYFQEPTSGGSAHYVADVGEIISCLPVDAVAWHAPPNPHTLGYEVCGQSSYTREQWLDPAVWPAVVLVAAQVKADAKRFGIPIHRLSVAEVQANHAGQCGHVDVSNAFHQSDHTDPGPNFPWDRFMALLQDPQSTSGVVSGGSAAASGTSGTPSTDQPANTTTEEDVMASLDEVRAMLQEELAKITAQLHADHKVILHGGDANHPYSIDSIARHVGVDAGTGL
jgi:hypothetical protein